MAVASSAFTMISKWSGPLIASASHSTSRKTISVVLRVLTRSTTSDPQ